MSYSIYKNDHSGGYHLHPATKSSWLCVAEENSICKKSTKTRSSEVSSCLTAQEARIKAANIGESFCGTCVSHLYKNY